MGGKTGSLGSPPGPDPERLRLNSTRDTMHHFLGPRPKRRRTGDRPESMKGSIKDTTVSTTGPISTTEPIGGSTTGPINGTTTGPITGSTATLAIQKDKAVVINLVDLDSWPEGANVRTIEVEEGHLGTGQDGGDLGARQGGGGSLGATQDGDGLGAAQDGGDGLGGFDITSPITPVAPAVCQPEAGPLPPSAITCPPPPSAMTGPPPSSAIISPPHSAITGPPSVIPVPNPSTGTATNPPSTPATATHDTTAISQNRPTSTPAAVATFLPPESTPSTQPMRRTTSASGTSVVPRPTSPAAVRSSLSSSASGLPMVRSTSQTRGNYIQARLLPVSLSVPLENDAQRPVSRGDAHFQPMDVDSVSDLRKSNDPEPSVLPTPAPTVITTSPEAVDVESPQQQPAEVAVAGLGSAGGHIEEGHEGQNQQGLNNEQTDQHQDVFGQEQCLQDGNGQMGHDGQIIGDGQQWGMGSVDGQVNELHNIQEQDQDMQDIQGHQTQSIQQTDDLQNAHDQQNQDIQIIQETNGRQNIYKQQIQDIQNYHNQQVQQDFQNIHNQQIQAPQNNDTVQDIQSPTANDQQIQPPNANQQTSTAPESATTDASSRFTQLHSRIRAHTAEYGGDEFMTQPIRRYKFLESMCLDRDMFGLVLHQLTCLWLGCNFVSPLSGHLNLSPQVLKNVFDVLKPLLRMDSGIPPIHTKFMMQFPYARFADLTSTESAILVQFRDFVISMDQHWDDLIQMAINRGHPLFAREIADGIGVPSLVTQKLLFRLSASSMRSWSAVALQRIISVFRRDQMAMTNGQDGRAWRNEVIGLYRQIAEDESLGQAARSQSDARSPQGGQAGSPRAPTPSQAPLKSTNIPTSQAPSRPMPSQAPARQATITTSQMPQTIATPTAPVFAPIPTFHVPPAQTFIATSPTTTQPHMAPTHPGPHHRARNMSAASPVPALSVHTRALQPLHSPPVVQSPTQFTPSQGSPVFTHPLLAQQQYHHHQQQQQQNQQLQHLQQMQQQPAYINNPNQGAYQQNSNYNQAMQMAQLAQQAQQSQMIHSQVAQRAQQTHPQMHFPQGIRFAIPQVGSPNTQVLMHAMSQPAPANPSMPVLASNVPVYQAAATSPGQAQAEYVYQQQMAWQQQQQQQFAMAQQQQAMIQDPRRGGQLSAQSPNQQMPLWTALPQRQSSVTENVNMSRQSSGTIMNCQNSTTTSVNRQNSTITSLNRHNSTTTMNRQNSSTTTTNCQNSSTTSMNHLNSSTTSTNRQTTTQARVQNTQTQNGQTQARAQPIQTQVPVQATLSTQMPSQQAPTTMPPQQTPVQMPPPQSPAVAPPQGPFYPPANAALTGAAVAGPYERRCAEHTAHLYEARSPPRRPRELIKERFMQYGQLLTIPQIIVVSYKIHVIKFEIPESEMARLQQQRDAHGVALPEAFYFEGALRYSLKLCQAAGPDSAKWFTYPNRWPKHFHAHINGTPLIIRRKNLWGKDLPAELTPYLVQGTNELQLVRPFSGGQDDTDKSVFYAAIEVISAHSQASTREFIMARPRRTFDAAVSEIKRRLGGAPHDDDDVIAAPESTTVFVADPFSFIQCITPVRGDACTHFECFDLATWLHTRDGKPVQSPQPGPSPIPLNIVEPALADKWACPICGGDARPAVLQVDEWMAAVVAELRAKGLSGVKRVKVAPDASWEAVVEEDDDDEEEEGCGDDALAGANASVPGSATVGGPNTSGGPNVAANPSVFGIQATVDTGPSIIPVDAQNAQPPRVPTPGQPTAAASSVPPPPLPPPARGFSNTATDPLVIDDD